eukprot:362407-Chlamydomonas_euryale.AAC.3
MMHRQTNTHKHPTVDLTAICTCLGQMAATMLRPRHEAQNLPYQAWRRSPTGRAELFILDWSLDGRAPPTSGPMLASRDPSRERRRKRDPSRNRRAMVTESAIRLRLRPGPSAPHPRPGRLLFKVEADVKMSTGRRSYSTVSLPTPAFVSLCCLLFGCATPAWMQLIQPSPPSPPPSPPGWDMATNRNVVLSNTATWQYGAQHVPLGITC